MLGFTKAGRFFSIAEKERIVQAVQQAEALTSGEVRVHVESRVRGKSPLDRAKEVFKELGMTQTELRNGVLIYLAVDDRKFAIIGDSGIDQVVGPDFWEATKEVMRGHFRQGRFLEGVLYGIQAAGEHLKAHFPCCEDDINELTDEISEGQ